MINQNIVILLLIFAIVAYFQRNEFFVTAGEYVKPNPDKSIIRGVLGNENLTGITKSRNINQDIRGI